MPQPPKDPAPTLRLHEPWTPPPDFVPVPGTLIGGTYEVREVLGSGGMGTVLRCWDQALAREVAVKLVHPARLRQIGAHERFIVEARTMAKIHDPNVVGVYAFGEHEGAPYFVMELVPGTDLRTWLARHPGPLPLRQTVAIIDQIGRGIAAIHAAGAIHRDVKPANVLVGPHFRLVVGDLGLATSPEDVAAGGDRVTFGTPRYMAPELVTQGLKAHTPAVDVYALAVIAYELLTGQQLFSAYTGEALLSQHIHEEPLPPSWVNPIVPDTFDTPVIAALAKCARDRPSIHAFLRAFGRAAEAAEAPRQILLADDDDACRAATAEMLAEEFPGARVVTVAGGAEAVAAATADPPSVAVLDLHMPKVGGADVVAQLRKDPRTAGVPIVVLSGVGGARDWQALREHGVSAFLVKPVEYEDLAAAVRRAHGTDTEDD